MKAIDLSRTSPSLAEILRLASEENLVLTTAEGRQFVLAEIDDFDEEVVRTRKNKKLMALLNDRSREAGSHSLEQVASKLNLRRRRNER